MPDLSKVWFDQKAITNIFSLADMRKRHQVTYDSDIEDAFIIHKDSGIVNVQRIQK